jgi:hypothetical protein
LGADGVGEFAFQLPHPIAALPQLYMPAVLLQRLINRRRTVGVGRVNYPIGDQPQVFGSQLLGVFDQLLLNSSRLLRVKVGSGEFLHGPGHNLHLLGRDRTSALGSSRGSTGSIASFDGDPRAERCRCSYSGGGFGWESCSLRVSNMVRLEKQYSVARSVACASAIKAWSINGSRFRKVSNRFQKLIFSAALR